MPTLAVSLQRSETCAYDGFALLMTSRRKPHVLMYGQRLTFIEDWARAAAEVADVSLVLPTPKSRFPHQSLGSASGSRPQSPIQVPAYRLRPSRLLGPINAYLASEMLERVVSRLSDGGRAVDCLHTHFYSNSAGPLRAARHLGLPIIHTEHSSTILRRQVSSAGRHLLQQVCEYAHAVFAVSEPLAEAMQGYGIRRDIQILPNPVDLTQFVTAPVTAQYPPRDHPRFVAVGWLTPGKDHRTLLQAFALVAHQLPGATLDIVGDGPLRQELSRLSETLGLAGRVHFRGALPRDEVVTTLAAGHVFVHSSEFETFGVSLVEAWGVGLPVVTFDCGGISPLAPDIGGAVVTSRSSEALARVMLDEVDRSTLDQREEIRHRALVHFDPGVVSQRLAEVYQEVLNVPPASRSQGTRRLPAARR